MKIVMLAPTPFFSERGTHLRIMHEALELRKRGYKITILTYCIGTIPKEFSGTDISVKRIPRILFWYHKYEAGPSWGKIILDIVLILKGVWFVAKEKPEILHTHLHEGVFCGWMLRKIFFWRKMKLVGDFHGTLVNEMVEHNYLKIKFVRNLFSFFERTIHKMPDRACASTGGLAELITRDRKDSVLTVHDAPTVVFSQKVSRTEYGIPENSMVVLYTGGFTHDKGVDLLIRCMQELQEERIHWIFAGAPKGCLDVSLFPKGGSFQVISPLSQKALGDLLTLATIAVDPKKPGSGQGSGKILNYMKTGLPIVCFDSEPNRELIGESCGELPSQPEEFVTRIKQLIENEEMRNQQAVNMQQRAALFSWERSCDVLEKLYE